MYLRIMTINFHQQVLLSYLPQRSISSQLSPTYKVINLQ